MVQWASRDANSVIAYGLSNRLVDREVIGRENSEGVLSRDNQRRASSSR